MDPSIQAWADQFRALAASNIRRHGWAIQYVGGDACRRRDCDCDADDNPPFAYTIGLFGMGHPELLLFGLPASLTHEVLNAFAERVRAGEHLMPGYPLSLEGHHHQFVPEEVPNPGEIVLAANRFYVRPDEASVPVLQLTYDDGTGVFPWDDGYPAPKSQPRPGTFKA